MDEASLRRAALNLALSLPSPILRLASGGSAVFREGRTLDARLQLLAHHAARQPTLIGQAPEEARRIASEMGASLRPPRPREVRIETLDIPGSGGALPLRIHRPPGQDSEAPPLVFAHAGGGVLGAAVDADGLAGLLALGLRAPVVTPDYRLAPEHRFPAALDDLTAAYDWALDNRPRLGSTAGGVAVGGEAFGGGLAAALADARRGRADAPALSLMFYPLLEVAAETTSAAKFADAWPVPAALRAWLLSHYLGPEADPADPRLSPARAAGLAALPPTVIAAAGFDPLLDSIEAHVARLRAAAVPVTYRRYDGLTHGFAAFAGVVPAALAAVRQVAGLAREALRTAAPD